MKKVYLIIFMMILSISALHGQGKLEKAEDDLKSESSNDSSIEDNNDYNNGFIVSTLGGLFVDIVYYSFYALFFESGFEVDHLASQASLTKYPFYNDKGNYSYEWDESTSTYRLTFSFRYIYENERIEGNHLNMDVSFLKRFGVEFDYLQLWENNPNFGDNSLAMYTFLAKYNRVRTESFDAYWGIGGTYIDGNVDEWGFTYGLGAELFIAKPISIESNFNQTIINDSSINKFNALLNYHIKQYKISGGYEHLKIGSQKFSMISVGLNMSL
ncbi:MAG: hypothetical protein KJN82_05400 [Bacteroidia bacterium]|nr:hypothetical protein [Bacteroidia bacterium]